MWLAFSYASGWPCLQCRHVAIGGVVPLISAPAAALCAAELAEAACRAGKLVDEAPLLQLLQHCSAALGEDVLAPAAMTASSAAEASVGSKRATEPAAGSAPAPASAEMTLDASAADSQPSAAPCQTPASADRPDEASAANAAGQLRAAKPDDDVKPPQQRHSLQPLPKLESRWVRSVAVALQVPQHIATVLNLVCFSCIEIAARPPGCGCL